MKEILCFSLLFFCSGFSRAQSSSINIQAGSGLPYFFESHDETVDIGYSSTVALQSGWCYQPQDFYFAWRLNFQFVNSRINGDNWETTMPVKGEISSLTTSLLLEKMTSNPKWNVGYAFGFGYTFENYIEDLNLREGEQRNFLSVTAEPVISYRISEVTSLRFSPKLLWFDPIKSLGPKENWYIGGEDLSLLFQVGVNFRL